MNLHLARIRAFSIAATAALAHSLASCADEPELAEPPIEATIDGDWIRLDGTVVTAGPSTFLLDYGEDTITVEVDDWDFYEEGKSLLAGDRVG